MELYKFLTNRDITENVTQALVHSPEAPKAKATRQLVRLEKSSLLMSSRLQTIVRAIKLNINYHSHSKSKNVQGQATH